MLITIENPAGIAPAIHPQKLGDNFATIADNVDFDYGVLASLKGITQDEAIAANTKSIYPYNGGWVSSAAIRQSYVGTVLANDARERIYYTDTNYPKIRSGIEEFRLGLPRPAAPAVTVTNAGDMTNPTDIRNTRYKVTVVDAWGAEGPASLASAQVEVGKGAEVSVDLSGSLITGSYNLATGALFRIYRSNSGAKARDYQFVAEVPYATANYADTKEPGDLQELLISLDWLEAPGDNASLYPGGPLKGLVEMPGVILAGYSGNTVFLSEPLVPTAWPYYYSNEYKIMGIAPTDAGLFCATEGQPFLLAGSDPQAMYPVPIQSDQACVSEASFVDFGGAAIFASKEGLVLAQGNSCQLLTGDYMDTDEWAAFDPSTIRAFEYRGKYVAFYGPHTDGTGFIFDPRSPDHAFRTLSGLRVTGGYYNDTEKNLYLVHQADDNLWYIGKFNEGTPLAKTWKSKVFRFPDSIHFSHITVKGDNFPVTAKVYADGALVATLTLPDDGVYNLPLGFRAFLWQVEISGDGEVFMVQLGENWEEMA